MILVYCSNENKCGYIPYFTVVKRYVERFLDFHDKFGSGIRKLYRPAKNGGGDFCELEIANLFQWVEYFLIADLEIFAA